MRMRVSPGGTMTPLPGLPDVAVPQIVVKTDDPELAYDVEMAIEMVAGAPVCTSLTAAQRSGGAPVTRQGLNSLPVNRIVREAVATVPMRTVSRGPGYVAYDLAPEAGGAVLRELTPRRGRPAPDPVTRKRMHDVVKWYRELRADGETRIKPVISDELDISMSYVSKLLAQARREGLLGPAVPGRAGEQPG